jgi:hypothetical protein
MATAHAHGGMIRAAFVPAIGFAFYFSVVLVYIQMLTNPYLTNPIGLSFVMMAIFSLRQLERQNSRSPRPARPAGIAGLGVQQ